MRLTNIQAWEAQQALSKLMDMDLPIKVSLDIALVSNLVDAQVNAFTKVRDNLFRKYAIKTSPGEAEGTVRFESQVKGETEEETGKLRQENLEAFMEKLTELMEAKTEDLVFKKIELPADITIKPEILKPLTQFVEVV